MPKPRVFLDTNIIIEAFRLKAWNELCSRFCVETVEKCRDEAFAGNPEHPDYDPVDPVLFARGLGALHKVNDLERSTFIARRAEADSLDVGEFDLLAFIDIHGLAAQSLIVLSTGDRNPAVVAGGFGWSDRLVTLEELLRDAGASRKAQNLRHQFTKRWLDQIKLRLILGDGKGPNP